jgi:hypothetical protein
LLSSTVMVIGWDTFGPPLGVVPAVRVWQREVELATEQWKEMGLKEEVSVSFSDITKI